VAERIPEIRFSGTWNQPKSGLMSSRTRLFFIVLPNFLPYLMIFQSSAAFFVMPHFEKSSNMAKFWQKMKKSLVRLAFNPFLQNASFGYPFHHY